MIPQIKIGDRLRDNDKRTKGRVVVVTSTDDTHVWYHTGKRVAKIALNRIFTDGKKRQRGFNLVP